MTEVIINSPSLDPTHNVSGISAVTQFIVSNNDQVRYVHFEIGRRDNEKGGLFRVFSILKSLRQWRQLLKEHREALIHFNFALTDLSIYRDSLYLLLARKRKMVVHLHGGNYLFSDAMPRPIKAILRRLFARDLPFVVLSEKEKERVEERFHAQRVYALPNCVDLSAARQYERSSHHEPLTLGYIGRIAEAKGMNELLEACTRLKEQGLPFRLVIAGAEREEDRYVERFKSQLGDAFDYVGIVAGQAKDDFMRRVDVFMLPTYFEGLPMSLLETMSFGCVPVTTDVGSIGTVVTDHENGLFVRVKAVDDLVAAVKALHDDPMLLSRLGKAAQTFVFEHFDPEHYIQQLNTIYQGL